MDKFSCFTPLSLAALGAGSFVAYVLGTWVYNLWFHPLRHIPGPFYAAMSPMWLTVVDLRFRKTHAVHALLQKYGGIVRIHPNQVAFLDQGVARFVYNKFPKSAWYDGMKTNEGDNSMSLSGGPPHAVLKRAYAPHYVPTNILRYQPDIQDTANMLMDKFRTCDGREAFDCLVIFRRTLIDVIFLSTYGQRMPGLAEWDIRNPSADPSHEIVEAVTAFPVRGVLKQLVPSLLWLLLDSLPIPAVKAMCGSDRMISSYVIRTKDQILEKDPNFRTTGEMNMDNGDERLPLLQRLLRQSLRARPEDKLSEHRIVSDVIAHTIGGVDTTNIVLSHMTYLLAVRPDILAKLREEIDPLMEGEDGKREIPDYSVLSALPYLNAFYMELLRVYSPVPAALERVVPRSLNEFEIKGYKVPAGTVVATQIWSVHRDPTVFPDPDAFKPERWLSPTEQMTSSWIAFGMGPRICGGSSVAHITIRAYLAAIVRNFDLIVPPETTPKSMAPVTAFVLLPAGHKVKITFKPRAD